MSSTWRNIGLMVLARQTAPEIGAVSPGDRRHAGDADDPAAHGGQTAAQLAGDPAVVSLRRAGG